MQGFYEQLGVAPDAATEELREAYRRVVAELTRRRKALLDQGGDTSQCDLARQQLDEAWKVLSEPALRRRYDAMRALDPADVQTADQLWETAAGSLVGPATSAAAEVVDQLTQLKIGALPEPPRDGEPLVPPEFEDAPTHAGTVPTMVPEAVGAVLPLPTAQKPAQSEEPALRVVDGDASSVIVLQNSRPSNKALPRDRVQALVQQFGFGGGLLQAVRSELGLALQEVSDTTRISVRYLEAVEAEQFDALPSATFVRGYVREMARVLGLNEQDCVAGYMQRLQD